MEHPFSTTKRWVGLCSSCSSTEIDGECKKDKKGRQLYVPRALCILSHQPFFTAFNVFLRELYRNAILDSEDQFADENDSIPRVESFEALLRKGLPFLHFVFRRFPLRHPSWRQHDTPSPCDPFTPITPSGKTHSAFHRLLSLSGSRLFDSRRRFSPWNNHSSRCFRRFIRFEFLLWRASPTPTSCVSSVFSLLFLPKTSWKSTQRSSRSSASSSFPSRWTP